MRDTNLVGSRGGRGSSFRWLEWSTSRWKRFCARTFFIPSMLSDNTVPCSSVLKSRGPRVRQGPYLKNERSTWRRYRPSTQGLLSQSLGSKTRTSRSRLLTYLGGTGRASQVGFRHVSDIIKSSFHFVPASLRSSLRLIASCVSSDT